MSDIPAEIRFLRWEEFERAAKRDQRFGNLSFG
jgi:hypothetical protein